MTEPTALQQITNIIIIIFTVISLSFLEYKFYKSFAAKNWVAVDLIVVYICAIPAFKFVIFDHISGWELWLNMSLPIFAFIASITCVTARDWILRDRKLGK